MPIKSSAMLLVAAGVASTSFVEAADAQQPRGLSIINYPLYSKPDEYAPAMLARVNEERTNHSLPMLCGNNKLNAAAQRYSYELVQSDDIMQQKHDSIAQFVVEASFACDSSAPFSPFDCDNVGSNGASGPATLDEVVDHWMENGQDSRANILGNFTMFGTAYSYSNVSDEHIWTQYFATGSTESCDEVDLSGDVRGFDPRVPAAKGNPPLERWRLTPAKWSYRNLSKDCE